MTRPGGDPGTDKDKHTRRLEAMRDKRILFSRSGERGSALVFFAFFILFLLGAAALAIDLGMLYVARSEAQRSADAAALAGASVFTGSCKLTASCESPSSEALAAQDAVAAAKANYVAGEPGTVNCDLSSGYAASSCPGIQFTDPTGPSGMEPQITVEVQRTGISLIFARMFNKRTGQVSAVATAEAYMGGAIETHVTPFLLPNCDPNKLDATSTNTSPYCSDSSGNTNVYAPFIEADGTIVSPDLYTGVMPGALGEPWTLHYAYQGFTTNAAGSVSPSQWSLAAFPDSNGSYSNSNNDLLNEIEAGSSGVGIACGTKVQTVTGSRPLPIGKAVNTLINATADGPNHGQDFLTDTANGPYQPYPTSFYGGATYFSLTQGGTGLFSVTPGSGGSPVPSTMGYSKSIVLAPLFNGNTLNPGNQTVEVAGFAVLFLDYSQFQAGQETIQANVINLIPCDGAGTGNTGVVADASPIPIRLIQRPN
jgi:Flp pilus assembly protein TadG